MKTRRADSPRLHHRITDISSPPMRGVSPRLVIVSALAAALSSATAAAQSPAPPPACETPEHRQFDFWIGEWEVVDTAGNVLGTNRITRSMNGCVLHEHWTGARGMTGESFNLYRPGTGTWHQSWVDSGGNLLLLDGAMKDGAMVLRGETPIRDGGRRLHRISYMPLENGDVRQLWEVSTDGGVTWTPSFDGIYRRGGG